MLLTPEGYGQQKDDEHYDKLSISILRSASILPLPFLPDIVPYLPLQGIEVEGDVEREEGQEKDVYPECVRGVLGVWVEDREE